MDPITFKQELPTERIIDTLCSATASSAYWCERIDLPQLPEGSHPDVVGWDGRGWTAFFEGPDDTTLRIAYEDGEVTITQAQARHRIMEFGKDRSDFVAEILNENDDGDTADVLLQYIALGEHVYG